MLHKRRSLPFRSGTVAIRSRRRLYWRQTGGRGSCTIAPGYLADINIIDLPAGGKRLLQKADGYVATIKSGQVTFRDGAYQGIHPGKLIRGPQAAASNGGGIKHHVKRCDPSPG